MEKFVLSQRLSDDYGGPKFTFTQFKFSDVKMGNNFAWNDFTVIEW